MFDTVATVAGGPECALSQTATHAIPACACWPELVSLIRVLDHAGLYKLVELPLDWCERRAAAAAAACPRAPATATAVSTFTSSIVTSTTTTNNDNNNNNTAATTNTNTAATTAPVRATALDEHPRRRRRRRRRAGRRAAAEEFCQSFFFELASVHTDAQAAAVADLCGQSDVSPGALWPRPLPRALPPLAHARWQCSTMLADNAPGSRHGPDAGQCHVGLHDAQRDDTLLDLAGGDGGTTGQTVCESPPPAAAAVPRPAAPAGRRRPANCLRRQCPC